MFNSETEEFVTGWVGEEQEELPVCELPGMVIDGVFSGAGTVPFYCIVNQDNEPILSDDNEYLTINF